MLKFPLRLILLVLLPLGLGACRFGAGEESAPAPQAPLISRELLLGDGARAAVRISPDGRSLAYLAPRAGLRTIWIAPVSSPSEGRPLTSQAMAPVAWHAWSADGRMMLYAADQEGDENWVIFAADVATGAVRALTPRKGVSARLIGLTSRDPAAVLVAMNARDPAWRDVYSINIRTGEQALVWRNDRGFDAFWADQDNRLRLASKRLRGGEIELWARNVMGDWARLLAAPAEDGNLLAPLGFDGEGRALYMLDAIGRDRTALVRVDTQTGEKSVLGESQSADVADVWFSAANQQPQAFAAQYLKRNWQPLTPEAKADLKFLEARLTGDARVVSRSRDDQRWIVEEDGPQTPPRVFLYDRANRVLRTLFAARPGLLEDALQPMRPKEIEARDGLTLVAYLTLPAGVDRDGDGRPDMPLPMIMRVHDGPLARDGYGFSAAHQWLANRGYAVLSVNFRGSIGFGKSFANAGNRHWGDKVQDDLQDALAWALAEKIADPPRVAIMGEGFGGYGALAAMAFHPGSFACAVSLAGPTNLEAYLANLPAYKKSNLEDLALSLGDPRTPVGLAGLRAQSPSRYADRIRGAVLIAQGERDAWVKPAQTEPMAQALAARGASVTYLVFSNEGHELMRQENRLAYFAAAESFLGRCLGGRVERFGPIARGARVRVPIGVAVVPGLAESLPAGADQ